MKQPKMTPATVVAYFDRQAVDAGPLLPDSATVSGLGTYGKYRQAVDLMAETGVSNVLDVGCNRGPVEFLFHQLHPTKAAGTVVHGIDVSSRAIERATALELPNCTFRCY